MPAADGQVSRARLHPDAEDFSSGVSAIRSPPASVQSVPDSENVCKRPEQSRDEVVMNGASCMPCPEVGTEIVAHLVHKSHAQIIGRSPARQRGVKDEDSVQLAAMDQTVRVVGKEKKNKNKNKNKIKIK